MMRKKMNKSLIKRCEGQINLLREREMFLMLILSNRLQTKSDGVNKFPYYVYL